jgi:Protein of unknown function (DUF2827)
MKRSRNKLRVGVTIGLKREGQPPWEWDLWENSIYLVQLLNKSREVDRAVLIQSEENSDILSIAPLKDMGIEVITPEQAKHSIDVMIEMGFELPDEWANDFQTKGGKMVSMTVENECFLDIESAIFHVQRPQRFLKKSLDAIWIVPGLQSSCTDYLSVLRRSIVRTVPSIWSPHFLKQSIQKLSGETRYEYRPKSKGWRVCSFDPSTTISHSLLVPLLICEEAYRVDPRLFENFHIANSFRFLDQTYFTNFKSRLNIVMSGMVRFDGRRTMHDCMSSMGDCNILHQSEGGQSYRIYETLYGRYPLIHNYPHLKEYGYYYESFDCLDGARVLLDAIANHDKNIATYNAKCSELLDRIDISHPENIAAYTQELLRLYA